MSSYQYGGSRARATAGRRPENLTPPLPLVRFELSKEAIEQGPKTINREELRSIPNDLTGDQKHAIPDKLHDPITSRRLAKWFVARSQKEVNYRQSEMYSKYVNETSVEEGNISSFSGKGDMFEYVVYESLMHQESKEERQRRNERRPGEEQIHIQRYQQQAASAASAVNLMSSATAARRKRMNAAEAKTTTTTTTATTTATALRDTTIQPVSIKQPAEDVVNTAADTEIDNNLVCEGADDESVASINSTSHSETTVSRNDSATTPTISYTPSLVFDAEFESGNLEKATRVIGRETLLSPKALEHVQDYQVPEDVDQEYDLVVRNDIYTEGNIQWYYFCVSFDPEIQAQYQQMQQEANQPVAAQFCCNGVTFPFRVRFNIVNMQKKDSLYNYGMKPAVLSIHENHSHGKDWFHQGYDICYYKNGLNQLQSSGGAPSSSSSQKGEKKKKLVIRNHYTLTFTYTFERPDTVYFAHTFPYTYSDLQRYLDTLDTRLKSSEFFHRRILCDTIAGNRCDVLTITERAEGVLESKSKPAVIVSARVHPGESNSSFMIQGLIDYLCSDSPEAQKLRKAFIFTIVPMLNPDGVIHGNYRCSLAGTDLNRRYGDANETMHPTVVAMKDMIKNIRQNRTVALYLDLHGHSKLKNSFIYGCDITMQPDKISQVLLANLPEEELNSLRVHCRLFPKILCTLSKASNPTGGSGAGYFSYRDCAFKVQKSKMGTGRVVCWRDLGILGSYTIEASFCGNGDNTEFSILKKHLDGYYSRSTRASISMPVSETVNAKEEKELQGTMSSTSNDFFNLEVGSNKLIGASSSMKSTNISPSSSSKRQFSGIESYLSKPDLDPAFYEILKGYKSYTHYQKRDLLMMGKHISLAIYHYANLTHADLAYEMEHLRSQNEMEIKARVSSANGVRSWSSGGSSTVYGRVSSSNNIPINGNPKLSKTTDDITSPHEKNLPPSLMPFSSPQGSGKYGSSLGIAYSGKLMSDIKLSPVKLEPFLPQEQNGDALLHSSRRFAKEDSDDIGMTNDDLDENDNDDAVPGNDGDIIDESGSDCSADEFAPKKQSDDQELLCLRSSSGSSKYNSKALAAAAAKAAIEEVLSKYRPMKLLPFENNMVGRLLSHCGVFSVEALQTSLQNYCNEFTIDRSTKNVGLRIKCELSLRRMLKLDRPLNLERLINMEQEIKRSRDEEEEAEAGSDDGSDSNPSVDNRNASKMLKNLKRFKDTNSLVAALRNALERKKKKEEERLKKQEKKMLARLAKQAELAKKQQIEIERQEKLNIAKEAKRKAFQPSAFTSSGQTSQKRSSRSSNPLSAPKYSTPLYRLAPEAKVSIPVQIKMMGFKDYDPSVNVHVKRGTMDQGRRQTFSSNTMTMDTAISTSLFSNANPNIANILGFGGGNNANIITPKVGNTSASDNLVDLLPGLCLPSESIGNNPKEDTPFQAALRLKNAIVNNREEDSAISPRLFSSNGSSKGRMTRANYLHHNPTFAPALAGSPEKNRIDRPSSSPGMRRVPHFLSTNK